MDRPILFSGPMVRALLDGRKTQTRRVINPQPHSPRLRGDAWFDHNGAMEFPLRCQSYAVGDRLWVREEWGTTSDLSQIAPSNLPRDARIFYQPRSSYPKHDPFQSRVRASVHMPRWASRLTLSVADVRVQRLQEISEEDAVAEGVGLSAAAEAQGRTGVILYRHLWDSLNAARGFGWSVNPWIVAVSFTVERRNIDAGG